MLLNNVLSVLRVFTSGNLRTCSFVPNVPISDLEGIKSVTELGPGKVGCESMTTSPWNGTWENHGILREFF